MQIFSLLLFTLLVSASCGLTVENSGGHPFPDKTGDPIKLNNHAFELTEGPSWDRGEFVYFTEIYQSKIHRYNIHKNTFELVREHTHDANGMMYSPQNQLWVCEQGTGRLVRFNPVSGQVQTLVDSYNGRPFNQPNDLALDENGGVYFTDPSWSPENERNQPVKGVYYASADGKVRLLLDDMDKPNGILLSRDGRYLYVVDMGNDEFRRYPLIAPGQLGKREMFAKLNTEGVPLAQPDGMAEDIKGNIYVAARNGIQIFSNKGRYLNRIELDQRPTNLAFYGEALNQLFVTTMNNLYSIPLNTRGIIYPP